MNSMASFTAKRLVAIEPQYSQLVMSLASILREGRYTRSLLFDAVLLADEENEQRKINEIIQRSHFPKPSEKEKP